jgi:hypothetical protein
MNTFPATGEILSAVVQAVGHFAPNIYQVVEERDDTSYSVLLDGRFVQDSHIAVLAMPSFEEMRREITSTIENKYDISRTCIVTNLDYSGEKKPRVMRLRVRVTATTAATALRVYKGFSAAQNSGNATTAAAHFLGQACDHITPTAVQCAVEVRFAFTAEMNARSSAKEAVAELEHVSRTGELGTVLSQLIVGVSAPGENSEDDTSDEPSELAAAVRHAARMDAWVCVYDGEESTIVLTDDERNERQSYVNNMYHKGHRRSASNSSAGSTQSDANSSHSSDSSTSQMSARAAVACGFGTWSPPKAAANDPDWLKGAWELTTLDLQTAEIGDHDALCLAVELSTKHCAIQNINMVGSAVGVRGLQAMLTAMEGNRTVTALNFVTNAGVFFEEWRAHEAAGNPQISSFLIARSSLLAQLRACVSRNQKTCPPSQMRFYVDDTDAYSLEFKVAESDRGTG